jgi:hypothetical protein
VVSRNWTSKQRPPTRYVNVLFDVARTNASEAIECYNSSDQTLVTTPIGRRVTERCLHRAVCRPSDRGSSRGADQKVAKHATSTWATVPSSLTVALTSCQALGPAVRLIMPYSSGCCSVVISRLEPQSAQAISKFNAQR